MVTMFFPTETDSGVTHERVAAPSMCTVLAPHSEIPQPNLVPVMPRWSRNTQSSGVSGDASTLTLLPFSRSVGMGTPGSVSPGSEPRDPCMRPTVETGP